MIKIYVCSPYRGEVEKNVKFAKKICRKIVMEGNLPIAPHLYFTQFMDDNIEVERNKAIDINLKILNNCDLLLICGNHVSSGMGQEIKYAKENGIEVKYYE